MLSDIYYMQQALEQAKKALAEGNLPIGTVIVHNGEIIATGYNCVDSKQSDLAHAEIEAITAATNYLFANKRQCEIYTTLEPCMLCYGAIAISSFKRLVVAAPDDRWGVSSLLTPASAYYKRIPEIVRGVLAEDSQQLINEYIRQTGLRAHLSKK